MLTDSCQAVALLHESAAARTHEYVAFLLFR